MKFVSCLPVSDAAVEHEEVDEVVLCESHFSQDNFPSSADAIENLTIEWLVLSEGSEIHQRHNCRLYDLQVFTDASETKYIWYELLRQLTSHKVYNPDMEQKVRYTRWICNAPEGGEWSLCMELKSGGIVRKIAQLQLTPASHCELNLFQMANTLFQECCACNDKMAQIKSQTDTIERHLNDLQEERKLLDQLLEKRDTKTRSVVVGLLNEKKRKIAELQRQLKDQGPQDAELINRYVTDPVRGHISPGRRRKRLDNHNSDTRRNPRLAPPPKKLRVKKEESGSEPEPEPEGKQEFKFLGIKKQDNPVKQEDEELPDPSTSSTNESTSHTENSTDEGENGDEDEDQDEDEEETDVE